MFFDKTSRKRVKAYAGPLAGFIEEHLDVYAVVSSNENIITVGHRDKRVTRQ
jgi:hypothetical protein